MSFLFRLVSTSLCAAALAAQTLPAPIPTNATAGCGLQHEADGAWLGLGARYKVRVADGAFTFTPALGSAAPRDLPLTLTTTHAGRGELQPIAPATMQAGELRVDLVRPELRERLEVRPDGVKHSYVFDRLPAGSGDLVVRARLATELTAEPVHGDAGGLRFTFASDHGPIGVAIGQVLGIDAHGQRATGSLRCVGDTLDFVLPAAFVQSAALPLVVDPLITPLVAISTAAVDETEPQIAHLATSAHMYLVVWRQLISATNGDIRAQRVNDDGTLNGALLNIEGTGSNAADPCVAASQIANKWAIAYQVNNQSLLVTPVTTTAIGTTFGIAPTGSGSDVRAHPTIASGALAGTGRLAMVWNNITTDSLEHCELVMSTATPGASPSSVLLTDTSSFTTLSRPSASRFNPEARFVLTWQVTNTFLGFRQVRGASVTSTGAVQHTFAVAGAANNEAFAPDVDGDGSDYVFAYATNTTLNGAGTSIVSAHVTATGAVLGTPRSLGANLGEPQVARFRNSTMVACSRSSLTANDVVAFSIDPATCQDCEGTLLVDFVGNGTTVAICSRLDETPQSEEGAVVYIQLPTATNGNVSLMRVAAADGSAARVVIGCSTGDTLGTCARVGNANFQLRLRGAAPTTPAFVLLSTDTLLAPCGPCTIAPDLFRGFVASAGNTNALGDATAAMPISTLAALSGRTLIVQWVLPGANCFANFDLAEGIRVTIE